MRVVAAPAWDLAPLLAPRSIAVVGASEASDSWAPEFERSLRHLGFDGMLHPVNPKYERVWGRPCLDSIGDLPTGVDLVVFVVPAPIVAGMIEDCAARGVRAAMVVSSGFAEAGEEGIALQASLREAALRVRLPVLGPNVEGFVNHVDGVAPYGTTPPPEPTAGGVSVISQSGTVAWTMGQLASDRGLGLRILLGVGNEAVLGLGDLFEWAAADRRTRIVASYVETMRDVDAIGRGLDALRRARKPVVICAPAGRSDAARRSIVAHTGALAGDTALRDAWLRGHGAVVVEDPVTLFEATLLLASARRVRAPGVAAAFQSGGACTLFAEAAGSAGLSLPPFAGPTRRTLGRVLPSFASQNNPLDVTGQAAVDTRLFVGALEAVAGDPGIGLVAIDALPPRLLDEEPWAGPVLARCRELRAETGVVFTSVAMSPLSFSAAARAYAMNEGIPFLQGHRAAAGAIAALQELQHVRRPSVARTSPGSVRARARRILRGAGGAVDERTAGELLELYGIRRPREAVATSPAAAGETLRNLRGPVAVKALAPELPHKAAAGGVRLGVRGRRAVEAAGAEVLDRARRAGATRPRILVQEMARGHEVLLGAVVDERFGPCLTLRPGGSLAERGEAEFVRCPLGLAAARAYVDRVGERAGLDPRRHDVTAVARAVEAVARAVHDLRDRLVSLEANPLLVGRRGAVAVDALAEARPRP